MGFRRCIPTGFWWGHLKERHYFLRPARIWEVNNKVDPTGTGWEDVGLDSSGSGCEKVKGCCEHGDET